MLLTSLLLLAAGTTPVADCLPLAADYTLMDWAEGWPPHVPGAAWLRCIQTGRYAFALETDTLTVRHYGGIEPGLDYRGAALAGGQVWSGLPPATLSLRIVANGRTYHNLGGAPWSQFDGPRLVDSGRFVQRADVTGLEFVAEDGSRLNADARFETVAWPDRLALLLAARPGRGAIEAGEASFGKVGGGFGLTGENHLEVAHAPELEPDQLTLELWVYLPVEGQVARSRTPWLVCKNGNEWVDGNYGLMLVGNRPRATINLGGGRDNAFTADGPGDLKTEQWHHLAMTYDGQVLRLFVDGQPASERKIGRQRTLGKGGLAIGRRQDNSGDGYPFRGVIDEIRLYDRALTPEQVTARNMQPGQPLAVEPVRGWSFDPEGPAADVRPGETWENAALEVELRAADGVHRQRWALPAGEVWSSDAWHETAVVLRPGQPAVAEPAIEVEAVDVTGGERCPTEFDTDRGWHRIDLDGVVPHVPEGGRERQNDAVERIKLTVSNPDDRPGVARLLFAKSNRGFKVRIGAPITGVSAFLRDADGQLLGLPVQLSKNWHNRPEGGVYAGAWFHGFTQLRLPPKTSLAVELNLVYGHFEGVPAASHAQLCLIGWGSNQLWNESALGAWGETICYEPDQAQARCAVLDVRPVMVRSMGGNQEWSWTHNVGGGDFFRYFDPDGRRVFPAGMQTAYLRQCPVLTEVLYAGHTSDGRIGHQATVSLARTDDLVRGIYRLRMQVREATPFSRFVIAQIGADSYSYTGERQMALSSERGLVQEWSTQWGGDTYRTAPKEATGDVPWISLHEAVSRAKNGVGAWANRGLIIREWNARLGGRPAGPWVAEHGVKARGSDTSTIDLVPPPGVTEFQPGDFVEATIEHVIMPQFAADYYGPNTNLRAALERDQNTWRMIRREAIGNDLLVEVTAGRLTRRYPLRIEAVDDGAEWSIEGGLGYVPVTIGALSRQAVPTVEEWTETGWQPVPGAVAWQTDYDAATRTWEQTGSLPLDTPDDQPRKRRLRFRLSP